MSNLKTSITDFFSLFSNRELAVYTWLFIFIIYILCEPKIRKATPGLLKQIFSFKLLFPYLLMMVYIACIVYVLYAVGFWNKGLLKDTIIWGLVVGISMYSTANDASKDLFAISNIIKDNLKATILLEFIIGTYVFSYPAELVLTFVMTLLVLLQLVSSKEEKHKQVNVFLGRVILIISYALLIYVGYKFIKEIDTFMDTLNQKSFWLPIFLSIGVVPYVYGLALYIVYEVFYVRINMAYRNNPDMAKFAKRKLFKAALFNLAKLRILSKQFQPYFLETKEEINEEIRRILP